MAFVYLQESVAIVLAANMAQSRIPKRTLLNQWGSSRTPTVQFGNNHTVEPRICRLLLGARRAGGVGEVELGWRF